MDLEKKVVRNTFGKFFVPTVTGSVMISVLSMTDLLVAGHFIGEIGLSAISVAYPVVVYSMILSAFFGMGGAIRLSFRMGQGKREEASRIFTTALTAAALISVLSAVLGLLFLDPLVRLMGASGGQLFTESRSYIRVLLAGLPFEVMSPVMVTYLRNDSEQRYAMLSVLTAGIVNFVLSVLLVKGAGMGLAGISAGTVLAEMLCCLLAALRLFNRQRMFRLIRMKPDLPLLWEILYPGLTLAAIFLSQIILTIVVNHRLGRFGGTAEVALYAVIKYLINFLFAFFDGVHGAMQPMLGIYYGERERKNVRTTAECGAVAMAVISCGMFLVMALGGPILCRIFNLTGEETVRECVFAFRILAFFCPAAAFVTFINGFYRCTGKTLRSLILSLADNLMFPVIAVLVLSEYFGTAGIWYGLLAGSLCTSVLIAVMCLTGNDGLLLMKKEEYIRPADEFSWICPAMNEELPDLIRQAGEYCDSSNISPKKRFYIDLIIEELAANVLALAGKDGDRHYIDVRISPAEDGHVTVRIRDNLTQFDPTDSGVGDLRSIRQEYLENGRIQDGGINELGIGIIKKIATEYSYRRTVGYNNFQVTI